ncbi:hypothetical protein BJ741DRAFT_685096 [Chytriomyces cf. hyalinus JEL632]|nr:hypothetical protein BJ741DRAFT_685096 [Chytriomyces cf. hyalinus JEL632]
MVTEVMGVLVGEVVSEFEAWDAWALLGGVDGQDLPNVPFEMISDIMIVQRADVISPSPCPEPTAPKPAPALLKPAVPPKPAAKYQYKKSLEMALIDLDKRMVKILSNTEVKLSALDLIAFSAAFRKKVNEISKTHCISVNKAMDIKNATAGKSGAVGFLQSALPVSIGSFAEDGSAENQLLMQKLFCKGDQESMLPSAVAGLLRYNAEHVVGHEILIKVDASEESLVY